MLVAEYEKLFTKLLKYVGSMVGTEEVRCRKFEKGLHKEIRTSITIEAARANFSQLIDIALRVEQSLELDEPEEK